MQKLLTDHSINTVPGLAGFLWKNAGFDCLRKIPELIDYEPRYDPTVIRKSSKDKFDAQSGYDLAYTEHEKSSPYTTISDFNSEFKAGRTTPTQVVETILEVIDKEPLYKHAFLSIKKDQVLNLAKAATERYKQGCSKGALDGVPVAIKGKRKPLVDATFHVLFQSRRTMYTFPLILLFVFLRLRVSMFIHLFQPNRLKQKAKTIL